MMVPKCYIARPDPLCVVEWLGAILGIYFGGWAIGWIYRGFKST